MVCNRLGGIFSRALGNEAQEPTSVSSCTRSGQITAAFHKKLPNDPSRPASDREKRATIPEFHWPSLSPRDLLVVEVGQTERGRSEKYSTS